METIDYLKQLADDRIKVARLKAEVKDRQSALEKTQEYQDLESRKEVLRILEASMNGTVEGLKDRIEREFIDGGKENTQPYDGVQVKKFQVVRILDERAAKKWAGENAPGALSIKTAQFNKIAKALDSLNFIEIDIEYRAQIATDLSMYEDNTRYTASTAFE